MNRSTLRPRRMRSPDFNGVRWAILHADGFPGDAPGQPSPAGRVPRAWLDLPSVGDAAHRLRHGTAEASHGS